MKKLSNRLSVKQSSTKEGQRELIREHTNKINEIIDVLEKNPRLVYVVEEKPYTAMRSTGEFCECTKSTGSLGEDGFYHCDTCGKYSSPIMATIKTQEYCGCTCHHKGKERCYVCSFNHIKPPTPSDEEIRVNVAELLYIHFEGYGYFKDQSESKRFRFLNLADKILTLVRGK